MRPLAPVDAALEVRADDLIEAMRALSARQPMNMATHAAHAAAFYVPGPGVTHVREDIGRHNALDKLVGALTRAEQAGGLGAVLMTSRVSIELVQKTAYLGASVLAAISAPSALAISAAEAAGITLCGVVRDNGLEVFTHAQRIL
jgi:FdhD protein